MTLPDLEYYRPKTLKEGLALLKEQAGKIRPLAGGTDLLNNMKVGLNPAEALVDLTGIKTLSAIECSVDKQICAGGTATIWDLIHQPKVKENLTALYQAGSGVGAVQHQQMGTIGGNLCQDTRCWFYNQTRHWRRAHPLCYKTGGDQCLVMKKSDRCHAAYCSDLAPALIAYGATIMLSSLDSERIIPLAEFYTGEGKTPTNLKPGEIISEITIPQKAWKTKSAYIKLRSRKSIDFPQAGVAMVVSEEGGLIKDVSLALTALGSGPVLVKGIGEIFRGLKTEKLDAEKISALAQECAAIAGKDIFPVANMSYRPAYRRRMVEVLIEETLNKIFVK
jgi:4-hydroxybenzoyl-CoA reductase subunit beta